MPIVPGLFTLHWPRVVAFALFGFVALVASISALQWPRLAGLLFLLAAPITSSCFIWWVRREAPNESVPFGDLALIFAVSSLPFIILGVFWLVSCRACWPTIMPSRPSKKLFSPARVAGSAVALCMLAGLFLALYLPVNGFVCHPYPPITAPQQPDQAVFTAKILVGSHGFAPLRHLLASWSLLRVDRRFWGVSSWTGFVILRIELPKQYADEYLIDGRRSQGLLMHFLPVIEFDDCSHTKPLDHAAVDLRLLQDGPPKSGVRIIGRVYEGELITNKPVPAVKLWIAGPAGTIATITDAQGIYDLVGLPAGHYSIRVDPAFLHRHRPYSQETDLKSGEIWVPSLITDIYGEYAPLKELKKLYCAFRVTDLVCAKRTILPQQKKLPTQKSNLQMFCPMCART